MKARVIIGANLGDEGKGTVVANYTKGNDNVLNILTNGGAQRGHSILTKDGSVTYQHFGSGTYYGADSYYSRFFILNPMQFTKEYNELLVKPKNVFRDKDCRWSTIFDMMANAFESFEKKTHATCGMGIWNTIKRYNEFGSMSFDTFMSLDYKVKIKWLTSVKEYYEKKIKIPVDQEVIWNSEFIMRHFIMDCAFMKMHTKIIGLNEITSYENLIFENGQGLLLSDTGKDTPDTTPSQTGNAYANMLLTDMGILDENGNPVGDNDVMLHYVTRPYLTRHGDGGMESEMSRNNLSKDVNNDRTNNWNEFQGEFRYGKLDIQSLKDRVRNDASNLPFEIELTHCDEMDRVSEFEKEFDKVNIYDSPLV